LGHTLYELDGTQQPEKAHYVITPDSTSKAECLFKKTTEQLLISMLGSQQLCADFFLLRYSAV
jgi:hypothetical protein